MQKFKRRRTLAIARFHARDQLIPGILFHPQLQVGKVIGDGVWRDNFYRVSATKQIQRQLSRTRLRAGDDPCQCHKARIALGCFLVASLMPKLRLRFSDIVRELERPGSKRPPDQRFAVRSGVNPPDQSTRSLQESPRLRIRCTVPERKWRGETTGGSVTPLESIAHARLPGV